MTSAHRTPSWQTQEEEISSQAEAMASQEHRKTNMNSVQEQVWPQSYTRIQIDAPSVVILLIKRDSNAQQKCSSASHATSLVTIQASVTKEASTGKFPSKLGNLRHTNYRQLHCIHKIVLFVANLKIPVQKILSAFNFRYSTPKQVSKTFLLLLI